MSYETPTETTNLDIYDHAALEWGRAYGLLTAGEPKSSYFLGTARPNGLPHCAPVGALWIDDSLYFVSGPETRKSKNIAASPACTISASFDGIDVVFEGSVQRVTDSSTLERSAKAYSDQGWPARADGDGFNAPYMAPSGGPPPWHLYRFDFHTAFGVATRAPEGATRWRFES